MGLDNIWVEPNGKSLPPVTFDPPLKLAVGWFTDPAYSFRGKRYDDYIFSITGINIYHDLKNPMVLRVADQLEAFLPYAQDLARMFRGFGNAGYDLMAWY